ncbi:MAG: ABC transporter permease [Acidimicrobiia bacterium]|nr:ABC transporter permease [Acidimicrobiia bacterium]
MNWLDTVKTGLDAIRSHRLRSGLTMLGILIGIAAVILTVGLGEGAQAQVTNQINALGTNLLVVSPGSVTTGGIRGGFGSANTLTKADADALGSKVAAPDIAQVAPAAQSSGTLTIGSTNWTTSVVGTTPAWATVRARKIDTGRFLNNQDESTAAAVVVLGPTTAQQLFGNQSPVGQTVTLNNVPLQVVGVLQSTGSTSGTANNDDTAVVPYSTAAQRLFGGSARTSVNAIYLSATSSSTLSAAYQEVQDELLNLHHITTPNNADFTITTQESLLTTANSVNKTLTVLPGGIGVMNIMLVSVTERVREIGLRKALGARPRVIRRQFLVEASVLGLAGGILGALLGMIGSGVLPNFINSPVTLSPTATVGAIVIAIAIGLAFGVYPASRAARLAPIDALRTE